MYKNSIRLILNNHINLYPTPFNLNYFWSIGSMLGIFLFIQTITGILISMRYTSNSLLSFEVVEYIMSDVKNGFF